MAVQELEELKKKSPLQSIEKLLNRAGKFADAFPGIEKAMLSLLAAEQLTIYQSARDGQEIFSKFKTGNKIQEIRLPLGFSSIAGYVSISQNAVSVQNVYDAEEIAAIHPHLRFNRSFDQRSGFQTHSVLTVPIRHNSIPLGVLQFLNKRDNAPFSKRDLAYANQLAQMIGNQFHQDFQCTEEPFEYLVREDLMTLNQLRNLQKKALQQDIPVHTLLMTELHLTPEQVGASLERYYQVPFMRYDPSIEPPDALFKHLNRTYLRRQLWTPVAGDRDEVTILIDDPSDHDRIMEIQQVVNAHTYVFRVGFPEDILRYLKEKNHAHLMETESDLSDLNDLVGQLEEEVEEIVAEEVEDDINEKEPTVITLVNRLIGEAHRIGASDIHIEPGRGRLPAVVRMRVDGVCRATLQIPATHVRAVVARIKVMARMDIAERRKPQDGKCGARIGGRHIDLRVVTIPTVHGESAVLRMFASGEALPFEKLNFSENNADICKKLITRPHGIFLVAGPTGSGKTTTLHAVLAHINTPEKKIWTAEDPVEITQTGLQQVQIHHKIGFNFSTALRAFLRADPDVILIGEMRDKETAHSAIEASLTGHLVFSTLHTNSAPETIIRLLELGLDPINFADALLGVLAQRLMRTLCDACKASYIPSEQERDRMAQLYGLDDWRRLPFSTDSPQMLLYRPTGCHVCDNTGYRKRTGIHELLEVSPSVREAISNNVSVSELRSLATQEGMRTLRQDGILKVLRGESDLSQLLKITVA